MSNPVSQGVMSFKVLGFPVTLKPTILLIVGFIVLMQVKNGPEMAIWGAIFGFVIVFSVLVHELGHAIVGRWLGMGPIRIELGGFGGVTIPSRNRGPRRGLLMTAAGPAAGLVLGVLSFAAYHLLKDQLGVNSYWLLRKLWEVNLFWSLFNLLPLLPMDGGLILKYGLEIYGARRAETIALWISSVTAITLAAIAFYAGERFIGLFAIYFLGQNYTRLKELKAA